MVNFAHKKDQCSSLILSSSFFLFGIINVTFFFVTFSFVHSLLHFIFVVREKKVADVLTPPQSFIPNVIGHVQTLFNFVLLNLFVMRTNQRKQSNDKENMDEKVEEKERKKLKKIDGY